MFTFSYKSYCSFLGIIFWKETNKIEYEIETIFSRLHLYGTYSARKRHEKHWGIPKKNY